MGDVTGGVVTQRRSGTPGRDHRRRAPLAAIRLFPALFFATPVAAVI
jgi:hypothetical protein